MNGIIWDDDDEPTCELCKQKFHEYDTGWSKYCPTHKRRRGRHLFHVFEENYAELHCNFSPDLKLRCREAFTSYVLLTLKVAKYKKIAQLFLYEYSKLECKATLLFPPMKLRHRIDILNHIRDTITAGQPCSLPNLTIRNIRRFCATYPEYNPYQKLVEDQQFRPSGKRELAFNLYSIFI